MGTAPEGREEEGGGVSSSSRRKGSGGEREVAKILAAAGLTEAVRMPLSGALADFPGDVRLNGWCAEVKRTERLDLWGAWRQACAAARGGVDPIVFNRRNHSPWLATLEIQTWAEMENELREWRRRLAA